MTAAVHAFAACEFPLSRPRAQELLVGGPTPENGIVMGLSSPAVRSGGRAKSSSVASSSAFVCPPCGCCKHGRRQAGSVAICSYDCVPMHTSSFCHAAWVTVIQ